MSLTVSQFVTTESSVGIENRLHRSSSRPGVGTEYCRKVYIPYGFILYHGSHARKDPVGSWKTLNVVLYIHLRILSNECIVLHLVGFKSIFVS